MAEPSTSDRQTWTALGVLWVVFFINYIDRQVVFSIFPVLRHDLGFNSVQLGLIGSIFIWAYAVSTPITGRVADVFRRDRIIILSLLLWSFATLATGLSRSVPTFLFWRGVMGVTEALYVPAALGLIGTLFSSTMRSRAMAIHGTAQFSGMIVGSWYGGWMADNFSWRIGLVILSILGICYVPFLALYFRRLPKAEAKRSTAASSPGDIFQSRCYRALAMAIFSFSLILWTLYTWLPNFVYEKFQLSMTQSGLIATLYPQVGSVIGILVGGILADQATKRIDFGRFIITAIGLILCSPFAYLTLATDSLTLMKVFSGLFGFFTGLVITNLYACSYDVIHERNYGFGAGFLTLVAGMASGTGVFLVGLWKETIGIVQLMEWAAIAGVLSGLILIIVAVLRFKADRHRITSKSGSDPVSSPVIKRTG